MFVTVTFVELDAELCDPVEEIVSWFERDDEVIDTWWFDDVVDER